MTKEDIIIAMIILMESYASKAEAADAIFRLWATHTELQIKDGKIVYKSKGEQFK